jgi:polyhydroxybutyrate depolymerase
MKPVRIQNFFIVIFIGVTVFSTTALADKKLAKREMQVGKMKRSYYIRYPQTLESQERFPLLIVLHGGGRRNGNETAKITGFDKLTDEEKFIAVFPNGFDGKWHDGRLPKRKQDRYIKKQNNDIEFIKSLVDYLIKYEQVDEKRVYLSGLSNGGMMTMRMACEASEKFAAVAPVIANMPEVIVENCKPNQPVSFLLMNGTEDPMVPWKGGQVKAFFKERGAVLSSEETFRFWHEHNQCEKKAYSSLSLPNINTKDKSVVKEEKYACKNNINMVFYSVQGGGHTLPGSEIPNLKRVLGPKNLDIDGAKVIWKFLSEQERAKVVKP